MKYNNKLSGFTLLESMIAMSIGLVVAGSAIWFLVQGTRISLKTAAASENDLAQWGTFTGFTLDARVANGMAMFPDFAKNTLKDKANRCTDKAPNNLGNVLILTRSDQSDDSKKAKYQQITGYVFDPATHVFSKFIHEVSERERTSSATLEEILHNNYQNFVLLPIAKNVTAGAFGNRYSFICRSVGKSGELNVLISAGKANISTESKKLVAASFYVRG